MKNLISIIFIIIGTKSFAQEVQIIDTTKWLCAYKYEFLQDSTSKYSLKQVQMNLQIGSHLSKFCDLFDFIGDSLLNLHNNNNDEATFNMVSKSVSGISSNFLATYYVYKNYPQNSNLFFSAYSDHKFFKVVQPMRMTWKLDAMKDTVILGYRCQRAFTSYAGREYTAWYTTQIPISEGPYKFNGLPGLIVKIFDSKNQHRFTLTSVKKLKYVQPITLSKQNYIEITPHEYVNVLRNKMARLFGRVQNGDIPINSDEAKTKSLQGLKAKNNFIEKY